MTNQWVLTQRIVEMASSMDIGEKQTIYLETLKAIVSVYIEDKKELDLLQESLFFSRYNHIFYYEDDGNVTVERIPIGYLN